MNLPFFRKASDHTRAQLCEFFLLDLEQRTPSNVPDDAREEYRAAEQRWRPALHLFRRGDLTAALLLYREAAIRFVRAKLLARGQKPREEQRFSSLFAELIPLLVEERHEVPAELERAHSVLASSETRDFAQLNRQEKVDAGDCLNEALPVLARLVETRSPRRLRALRALRFVLAALVFAVPLTGWLLVEMQPKNIARNRPVRATPPVFGTSPRDAVNGVRFGQLGYHSELASSPWLTIDLGADYKLSAVKVYGRADCCYEQSVPMTFDISRDGQTFKTVAQRVKPFSAFEPWTFAPTKATARFVRLQSQNTAYLVVAEVEVFGKRR